MMGAAVRAALLASPGVVAIVKARVYPIGTLPQAPATDTTRWPAISYQRIGGSPEMSSAEGVYRADERIQVDCWAATYDGAQELGRLARAAAREARGGVVGGQTLMDGTVIPGADDYEADTKLHRVSFDWVVTYKEEVA